MTQKKITTAVSVGSRERLASRGIKTYSESRMEMRNLQILNQDVVLNIAGVEKYAWKTCGCGEHWKPFDSSFERKERWQVILEPIYFYCSFDTVSK